MFNEHRIPLIGEGPLDPVSAAFFFAESSLKYCCARFLASVLKCVRVQIDRSVDEDLLEALIACSASLKLLTKELPSETLV